MFLNNVTLMPLQTTGEIQLKGKSLQDFFLSFHDGLSTYMNTVFESLTGYYKG